MFYRRKIILALLQLFGGQKNKISLQKLLFLFTQHQTKAEYDFIPYKYGCYSYSANADLMTMVNKGILSETKTHFNKVDKTDYMETIKETDKKLLQEIKLYFGNMTTNELMKYVYSHFPYWAINSEKAEEIYRQSNWKK